MAGELVEIAITLDSASRQLSAWHARMTGMVFGNRAQDVGLQQLIEVRDEFGAILAVLDQTADRACSHQPEWPAGCGECFGSEQLGMLRKRVRELRQLQAALQAAMLDCYLGEQAPPG